MLPENIDRWLEKGIFPQRALISGLYGGIDVAFEIASRLQGISREVIEKGLHSDTIVFRDTGKSFRIDWSEEAKKDNQGEYENVRGLIKWSNKKPIDGKWRIVILENLERFSREAPHACLKLIEEPPSKTVFLFTTKNHHHQRLLDTIISRLTLIRLPRGDKEDYFADEISDFYSSMDRLERFAFLDELDKRSKDNKNKKIDRKILLNFVLESMAFVRVNHSDDSCLELLLETYQSIQQNINTRLVLERLVLHLE